MRRRFFDYSQRSVAMGPRGMVASSQQLATLAGYRVLSRGGNAVDAAVATSIVLNVVEPHSTGIGGDAFALIYMAEQKRLLGMNASGRAPKRVGIDWFKERGLDCIPQRGLMSVTVPGALHGFREALKRCGSLPLEDLFEDAIYYAETGFPVTEVIAGEWKSAQEVLAEGGDRYGTYLIDGRAPRPGQIFRNTRLASTLRKIAREGIEAFYEGEICRAITGFCSRGGWPLSDDDLSQHSTTWVEPISTEYRGYTIYELPPNCQGITVLEMLNILEGYDIPSFGHNSAEYLHLLIEAKKIAFADRDRMLADPEFEHVPVERIISKEYAARCRKTINPKRASAPAAWKAPLNSDTVFVTAVDEKRNAVSLISSIYMPFGSGKVVDGTGIVLQNRGSAFSLDPQHPNRIAPRKRPMHTLIPGMVFKDGWFLMSFGVMGGDMQPQGHVQFLLNMIDFKLNPQEAMDAPRVRHMLGPEIYLEDGIPSSTASGLESMGHRVSKVEPEVNIVGGGQAIYLDRGQDVLLGASDRRKDGCAIGY